MNSKQILKFNIDSYRRRLKTEQISRRAFIRMMAGLGVSLGLGSVAAQCGVLPESAAGNSATEEPVSSTEAAAGQTADQLEIFTWWGGTEAVALQTLFDLFSRKHPQIEIISSSFGTFAGIDARDLLLNRMQSGDPPDSFQIHLGQELIDGYAIPGQVEPLDFLYEEEGWNESFPADLVTIASWDGHPWSVPVNIHRSNVLWWNPRLFQEAGIDAPPESFDEFLTAAARLKDAGYDGMSFGESHPGFTAHVFEGLLAGHLGPEKYRGLWTGETDWNGSEVEETLMFLREVLENFANEDYLNIDWVSGTLRLSEGTAGMVIMGDWLHGQLKAEGFTNYAWAPSMSTQGIFVLLSDSFPLPKNAPHRENAINWLRVVGSKEGQEDFNVIKGSIPTRTDVDLNKFDAYQRSAIEDFKRDTLLPSVVHGAAAKDSWVGDFVDAINIFANNKDIRQAQENLARACQEAGMCG